VVTSSHNPIEWNGLKFISSDSLFLSPAQCGTLYDLSAAPPYAARQGGALVADDSWTRRHVQELLACPSLQPVIEKIRARKLRVRYNGGLVIIQSR
jgi:phosphomannomutase